MLNVPETAQPSLFAEIVHKPGIVQVKFIGPGIGQREAPILTDMIGPAMAGLGHGLRHLVLDLSQVTFMNSMALGMCVDFRNRAAKVKATVIICGMNAELTRLFKMVKFDSLFTIVSDTNELAKALAK